MEAIPSHTGLRPRISMRVWPITGSRSIKGLALIPMIIGLAPICGRQRGEGYTMVARNLDLKPAYKVTPISQERHHTNETYA
jgi:hypothetical protein